MTLKVKVHVECPFCHEVEFFYLDPKEFKRWDDGEHIQNVWPEMPAEKREQLISGCCPTCWDYQMKDPDD